MNKNKIKEGFLRKDDLTIGYINGYIDACMNFKNKNNLKECLKKIYFNIDMLKNCGISEEDIQIIKPILKELDNERQSCIEV